MIRKLHTGLEIAAKILIRPYNLLPEIIAIDTSEAFLSLKQGNHKGLPYGIIVIRIFPYYQV